MKNRETDSARTGSRRELRVALSCEVHDHVQRLAKLRRCSPAEVVENALREQILAEAVEKVLQRATVVDQQIETIAGYLLNGRRAPR